MAMIICYCFIFNTFAQNQIGQDIDGEAAYDNSGSAVSMPDMNTVAIGASGNDGSASGAGHVRVYEWNGTVWIQKGSDIDGDAADDHSGCAVSMPDAGTLAIGADYHDGSDSNTGQVKVFEWSGTAWAQKGPEINGTIKNDYAGRSVFMPDASTVALGAMNSANAGRARIYEWDGEAWIQKGSDINGEAINDNFGYSLSMPDKQTIAVGAYSNDGAGTDAGHVRVYTWNTTTWVQKGTDIDGQGPGEYFGWSLSMPDENTLAVGAPYSNGNGTGSSAGQVRVFYWDGSSWVLKGYQINGEAAGDLSGWSVNMPDANTVAIGAYNNDGSGSNAGHVRIYKWNGTAWIKTVADIDGEAADDQSGYSVSMPDASTIAIGARSNDGNGTNAGQVRVYGICTPNTGTDLISSCNSYTWIDGVTYTESNNTASYTLTNAGGCDSVVTLNLTISYPTFATDEITACGSYTWIDGNTYTENNNTATYTLTNAAGCDSLVTLDLTINTVDVSVTNCSPALMANEADAEYQWLDCSNDMAAITGETQQTFIAQANSSYAVQITKNNCTDTSACEVVNNVSIQENDFEKILALYPNPTSGNLQISLSSTYESVTVRVQNELGQEINKQTFANTDKLEVNIEGPAGIYFVEIAADFRKATLKVIKE